MTNNFKSTIVSVLKVYGFICLVAYALVGIIVLICGSIEGAYDFIVHFYEAVGNFFIKLFRKVHIIISSRNRRSA